MNFMQIPKVELHCHIDGIISSEIVIEIHRRYGSYPIYPKDFNGKSIVDYESFGAWWKVVAPIAKQLNYLYPVIELYIEQLKRQNVRYVELMLSSSFIPSDIVEAVEKLGYLRQWVNTLEVGQIQVEFLVAFGRERTAESIQAQIRKIIRLFEAGLICGIAIAGPEPGNRIKPFHRILAEWHEVGLGIELHAGEWCGPNSVWDALNYGFPDRIGHGVAIFSDPKLIELFQERQIHIEMCPSSNVCTGSIRNIERHPILRALDLGMNFSINTDDPGPFACSMTSEFELVSRTFGLTESDFNTVFENSLNARFQDVLRISL